MRAGTTFSAWSYLKPRFPAGAKTVKVKLYRYRNGWWRYGHLLRRQLQLRELLEVQDEASA